MTTHRIIGLPGTGKTTNIVKEIDTLFKEDVNIMDISLTTFSRRMANELVSKFASKYELDYKDLYNVGTIHGLCRRQLNVNIKENLLKPKDIRQFAEEFGISSDGQTPQIPDPAELMTVDGGMMLLAVDSWLRNTLTSFDDIEQYPGYDKLVDEFNVDIVPDFMSAYTDFKTKHSKVDFTDLLEMVCNYGYGMGTTAFFCDEFQDMTPLLHAAYEVLKSDSEHVFICGDPFQMIYNFMGADTKFLLDARVDIDRILPITYRFGENICDFSAGILEAAGHLNIPNITSSKQSEIIFMDSDEYFDFGIPNITEDVFHLVRCGYMAYPIAKKLIESGVPFTGLYGWSDTDIKIFNGLLQFKKEGRIFSAYLKELVKIHPSNFFSMDKNELVDKIVSDRKVSYTLSDIQKITSPLSAFSESNFLMSLNDPLMFADTSDMQYNKIVNCLNCMDVEIDQKMISTYLGTIHSAKGEGVKNVFVWDETNKTITDSIYEPDGMRSEASTWFVAATRAEQNLYWVDSNKRHAWGVA